MTQTFLAMLCHFKSGTFFFFSGWVVVMTIFVYLFLPETKGVPIERMDRIWKQHWFWKRYMSEQVDKDTPQKGVSWREHPNPRCLLALAIVHPTTNSSGNSPSRAPTGVLSMSQGDKDTKLGTYC
jgi:hypothetical protein